MKIKFNDDISGIEEVKVTSRMVGTVDKFPFDEPGRDTGKRYKHLVTVSVKIAGLWEWDSFVFYDSIANYDNGRKKLDNESLKHALWCVIDDAFTGMISFEDFRDTSGYSNGRTAKRVHEACKRTTTKIAELGIDGEDPLREIINALDEKKYTVTEE